MCVCKERERESSLQTAFILLNLSIAVGASLCYLAGELLRLGIFIHANVEASSLRPLTDVLTTGRLMSLQQTDKKTMITGSAYLLTQHTYII